MTAPPRRAHAPILGRGVRIGGAAVLRRLLPLLALLALGLAARASACSCIPQPLAWHIANTGFIAEGTVLSIDPYLEGFVRVRFAVSRTWKAPCPPGDVVEITTSVSGGGCGYSFVDGESYLLFAQPSLSPPYGLGASSCGWTQVLSIVGQGTFDLLAELPPPPVALSDPEASFAAASAVFRGRVLQVGAFDAERDRIRFSVLDSWKGTGTGFVEVLVNPFPGSGGFLLYTDHVVFAGPSPDGLTVACGESVREEDAAEVLAWLDEHGPVPVQPVTWGRLKATYGLAGGGRP